MRRAAKVDANQGEIVNVFRNMGCAVLPLHAVGKGCPDLLISTANINILVEIKDGSKPPSQRLLTPDQQKFHMNWKGPLFVIKSTQEAIDLVNGIRA
ncbi:hypothetical protein UFOVP353_19 [uncultured Caudovirales phage]|uniref:VRR-NUC domain containing protein n=1 Tax=uncultured Caudovirales phage TaxID=2100421 RepID=A0A6J5LYX7_9CAUD|nr:hypothetical protein UFOVP353_19 [uncultured Caudovirales phage]